MIHLVGGAGPVLNALVGFWEPNFVFVFVSLRQDFSVALKPVLELALVHQAGLKLREIGLPLLPEC